MGDDSGRKRSENVRYTKQQLLLDLVLSHKAAMSTKLIKNKYESLSSDRFWRSKVKGEGLYVCGGEGTHVDAGALKSIF